MKRYQIIYADPPWEYRHCASDNRKIENHYPTMTKEELRALKIPCEENSLLYLWVTAPKVEEGVNLIKAWGFDYRSCLIWDKEIAGLGYWSRVQHEIIFVGVRGEFPPPAPSLRIPSIFRIRRGEHSDKPDFFRAMIDRWYPDCTKLEMFCRDHTPLFKKNGWDVFGNEVSNGISLTPPGGKEEDE